MLRVILLLLMISFVSAEENLESLMDSYKRAPYNKNIWKPLVLELLSQQMPEQASKLLTNMLKTDALHPFCMGIYSYLLLTYEKKDAEAKDYAQKVLNLYPSNIYALHTLAWYHYQQKNHAIAVQRFEEIKQKDAPWFELQYHWGLAAWKANSHESALRHFQNAYKINNNSVQLNISLGLFHEESGKIDSALRFYNRTLSMVAEESPIKAFLFNKINALLPLYKRMQATRSTQQNTAQNNPKAISKPVTKLIHQDKQQEQQVQNPFLADKKKPEPSNQLSGAFQEYLSQEEHYFLGVRMLESGLRFDSTSEFNTVINLNATNVNAVSANTMLKEAMKLPQLSQDQRIAKLFSLAEVLFTEQKLRQSIFLYRKILLIQPEHPQSRKNLAFLLLHVKKPVSALEILNRLTKDYPDYVEAIILKGYALAKLRRFPEASQLLNKAISITDDTSFSKEYAKDLIDQIKDYDKPLHSHP